jgi:hypothetical protein
VQGDDTSVSIARDALKNAVERQMKLLRAPGGFKRHAKFNDAPVEVKQFVPDANRVVPPAVAAQVAKKKRSLIAVGSGPDLKRSEPITPPPLPEVLPSLDQIVPPVSQTRFHLYESTVGVASLPVVVPAQLPFVSPTSDVVVPPTVQVAVPIVNNPVPNPSELDVKNSGQERRAVLASARGMEVRARIDAEYQKLREDMQRLFRPALA